MSTIIRIFFFSFVCGFGHFAAAQDNVGEESTIVYNNDYFAQWSPVTAQDMIDRIPGLTEGGSSRGGFGGSSGFARTAVAHETMNWWYWATPAAS